MEAAAAGESGGDSDSDSYGFPGQVDESSSPPQNSADAVDRLPGQPDPEKNELDRRRKSGTEQTPAPPSVRRGYTASHNYSDAEGQRMDERSSSISRGQLMLDMMNTETNVDEQWSVVWAENDDNPDPESSSVQQTAAIVHTSGKADDDGAPSAVVDKFTNEDLDVQFAVCYFGQCPSMLAQLDTVAASRLQWRTFSQRCECIRHLPSVLPSPYYTSCRLVLTPMFRSCWK